MTNHAAPTIIIIVGITGDLAKRKLLPAIDELSRAGVLPNDLHIIGITRQADISIDTLTKEIADPAFVQAHMHLFQMNVADVREYAKLTAYLQTLEAGFSEPAQRLFYLSVPPQVSQPIIENLGASGLSHAPRTKLLLEKPFGVDLSSAADLVTHIHQYFTPDQVYRIDHYLAKEMAQNIIVFREANILFKKTWNKDFIESIQIIASEKIDIERRSNFYEQTGALRDLVQSHLLQLAALTLMDVSGKDVSETIPARRLQALRQLHVAKDAPVQEAAIRKQYEGYQDEVNNPGSLVETYVELTLQSDDVAWRGVLITLITGKALRKKTTEIRIRYRQEDARDINELILRLQPNEGVELRLLTKQPGYEQQVEERPLHFAYHESERLPEAYERVFLDAIRSDHSLFATGDEILETWRILDPVQRAWEMASNDLGSYKKGSDINTLLS
jgi:glucose-6-phosphate 1-dehydrogenase